MKIMYKIKKLLLVSMVVINTMPTMSLNAQDYDYDDNDEFCRRCCSQGRSTSTECCRRCNNCEGYSDDATAECKDIPT